MAKADQVHTVTQGDLYSFDVTPRDAAKATYDLTVGTWQCQVAVYDTTGIEVLTKTITGLSADNASFAAYFTETETATFPTTTGLNTLALISRVRRIDTTPVLSIERDIDLVVNPQRITA